MIKLTKKKSKKKPPAPKRDADGYINPMKSGQKDMLTKCITKFWKEIRPALINMSTNPYVESMVGKDGITKYGYEGGLEETIRLFEKGKLKICAESPDNFFVYMTKRMRGSHLYDMRVLYDTTEGRAEIITEFFKPTKGE